MKRLLLGAVILGLGASQAHANTLFSMTPNTSVSNVGDELGSGYDVIGVVGASGGFALAPGETSQSYVGIMYLDVGANCNACDLTPSGNLTPSLTIDGVTHAINIAWNWFSSGPTDTVHFGNITPVQFAAAGGGTYDVSFTTPADLSGTVYTRHTEVLAANITYTLAPTDSSVPEPMSLALLATGIAGVTLARRRKATTA